MMNDTFNLENQLCDALSSECFISVDTDTLKRYIIGTEGFQRTLVAVVKPSLVDDVQKLLQLANSATSAFAVHPISTGKNWGYGSANPPTDHRPMVLLDLSRLNNIVLHEEFDLATVEPGVTQQQLYDFIQERQLNYMVPTTGAGPDVSILANALERGYGITPYTQHFDAVTAVSGFWGNGEPYYSALSDLDGSGTDTVNKSFKYSPGPYLDGLFTQSNLGIVTQMTIRLARKKESSASFFVRVFDDEKFEQTVHCVQELLRDYEGLVGSVNLMDKRRMISMFAPNPNGYELHKVMSDAQVAQLTASFDFPEWTAVGTLYGTASVVRAAKREIKKKLKALSSSVVFSNDKRVIAAKKLWSHLPSAWLTRRPRLMQISMQLAALNNITDIMMGKPNRVALTLAYWRNPAYPELKAKGNHPWNPARDGCGLLWYAPLVPLRGQDLSEFVAFVRRVCPQFNIEPLITLTLLRHDSLDSTVPILFNAQDAQAIDDAHRCLRTLTEEGLKKGWVPYRLNIEQQQWMLDPTTPFWQSVARIKSAVDPNSVISPGRYCP